MDKIPVINGLRGFAILAVIWHHLLGNFTAPGYGAVERFGLTLLPFTHLANGWLGVNLFFMLSGFVLAHPYLTGKRSFDKPGQIKWFYLHRAKRLLPLYYFSVLICVIFVVRPASAESFVREAFLLASLLFSFTDDMWMPRYNWVLWSLGVEFWFSILFPFLFIAIKRYGFIKVLPVTLMLALGTRIIGNDPGFDIGDPHLNPLRDSLAGRLDEFLLGMLVCHLYVNRRDMLARIPPLAGLTAAVILLTLACLVWDYARLQTLPRQVIPFAYNLLDIGLALLMLTALSLPDKGLLKRLFSNYPIQLLGLMCYSLYVWHYVAISQVISRYDLVHVSAYLLLLMLLAGLSYRYIEFGHVSDTRRLFLLREKRGGKQRL